MKYVFIAHSHTLVLCSLGTINYLNLPHEDCLFLATRNYKMPKGLTDVRVVDANKWHDFFSRTNCTYKERRQQIKQFDEDLGKWTNKDNIKVFIPHLMNIMFYLMATYSKSKEVMYVQEGAFTAKYCFYNHHSLFRKIRGYLSSIIRYRTLRMYPCYGWYTDGSLWFQNKIKVYCLNKDFFQYMPQDKIVLNIIKWPECKEDIKLKNPKAPIFVFDAFVKNGLIDKDIYYDCCKRLINENYGHFNYLKFHPGQSQEERLYIISIFEDMGKQWETFTEDIPFEFFISKLKDLKIVGFGSSLLYFAHYCGHNVIAHSSWLLQSPLFAKYVEQGYPIFDKQ